MEIIMKKVKIGVFGAYRGTSMINYCKRADNAEVVAKIKDFLASDGVLVTFQNGLPEMQIADVLGEGRVLGCTVAWGATLQGPGVCELTSEPDALSFSLGSISAERSKHFDYVKHSFHLFFQ